MDWWKHAWKSEGLFKKKINLLLALNNKPLTWENLKKRCWNGPRWCALCHSNEETGSHLFVVCSYAETVWKAGCNELKFQGMHGASLEHKAKAWWDERSVCLFSALPSFFFIWNMVDSKYCHLQ